MTVVTKGTPIVSAALRVLVMGGKTEGFHEFKIMEPIYSKFLGQAGFDVTTTEDRDLFKKSSLEKFDVVVDYTTGDSLSEEQSTGLLNRIRSGMGFVGVHSAADSFHNCRAYERMVGGIFLMHPGIKPYTFKVLNPNHPVMAGVADFVAPEELYLMETTGHFELLMSTYWDGFERPVAWVKPYGFGRIFYTALGHGKEQHESAMFQRMVVNAVRWTCASQRG